jgi:carboxyl-terminal processing protease
MNLRLLIIGAMAAALYGAAAETPAPADAAAADAKSVFAIPAKYTNTLTLKPNADDGKIARTVGRVFERMHYTRHNFDKEQGRKMFDEYVNTLDPQRLYLLQSDLDEYSEVRDNLDEITMRKENTEPAYGIFNRFLLRYDQAYAYVIEMLQNETFRFDGDDAVLVNRKNAPRPKDLAEARKLWRDRLRFEYLGEKLDGGDGKAVTDAVHKRVAAASVETLTAALTNKFGASEAKTFAEAALRAFDGSKSAGQEAAIQAAEAAAKEKFLAHQHDEIVKKLARRYQRVLRNLKQFEADEVLEFWLDALGHAYDPHTDYMGKRELEQFAMSMNLRLFGIGATLASEDGYTVIKEIRPGTPAENSKQLKVNDKIVGVAQGKSDFADVVDEKLSKVVEQIRGPKGSEVRLAVIPAGADSSQRKVISIIRDEIKLEDAEAKAKLVEMPLPNGKTRRVGVIDLPSFYANFSVASVQGSGKTTTGDVAQLIKKLTSEGAEGLILDLRRNGGGSLEEAINLTGLFIKSGPVVQVRSFDGGVKVDEDNDDNIAYDGPLIVLTSRFSASASEIVAAALQDYGRALIVGDISTHGKGTVQTVQELGQYLRSVTNPGAVKTTIRKFYRASGGSTQLKGVTPDIVLPGVNNYAEVGEASLDNALAWDTIEPAPIEKVNRVEPYKIELEHRSTDRVAHDRNFDYVREDVAKYREALAKKSVSLNEAVRRREMDADKARLEARKKEIASRHEAQPTTYSITLKAAAQPGLPPADTNHVAAATPAPTPDQGQGDDADVEESASAHDSPPPTDLHLRETERILLDYIQLLGAKAGVVVKAR